MRLRGLKKAPLADDLEITRQFLDGLLDASSNPKLNVLDVIAKKFDITPQQLLDPEFRPAELGKPISGSGEPPSHLISRVVSELHSLRERISGIPADILNLLVDQDEFVYESIRSILSEPGEEKRPSLDSKKNDSESSRG